MMVLHASLLCSYFFPSATRIYIRTSFQPFNRFLFSSRTDTSINLHRRIIFFVDWLMGRYRIWDTVSNVMDFLTEWVTSLGTCDNLLTFPRPRTGKLFQRSSACARVPPPQGAQCRC
ncbi:hypothetical protein HETIRDRAFT_327541 [Heterobasidion irregulare TC 32-1]|uniref:Uncharacterized protein n=1 Tax=Heterobasidion irregulare (strain TC 32-1) TaxID=747525 RepID=W4JUY2_HETIT|nr:uncharacterized protein HETIRDRAFT_327541 [Heterobasidion irregulare TC 32-1]ETW77368.1 hypothetical protein HETIRDRAFT_327541 [Heterobasidion irregulare TC 32-1]